MRLLALLAAAAFLAGCLDAAPTVVDPASTDVIPAGGTPPAGEKGDEPVFCESADDCDFFDEDYHEYVLYNVDSVVVDVLIVPSGSADNAADTPILKAAVDNWAL